MTHVSSFLAPPSPEFIALCQSQLELLTEVLKADWSAVYLTQGWPGHSSGKLFPVLVYPHSDSFRNLGHFPELPGQLSAITSENTRDDLLFWEIESDSLNLKNNDLELSHTLEEKLLREDPHQIILPLIYEGMMIGLLVTGKNETEWNEEDVAQIGKIVKTLALARCLDQRQGWYQEELQQKYTQTRLEHERLDNLLHQLRNPLTALKIFGKLLLKHLLPLAKDTSAIQGILRESERIQDLLTQFEQDIQATPADISPSTVLALPEANSATPLLLPSVTPNLEPVSLKDILSPLVISAQAIAAEKNLTLTASLEDSLPLIQANPVALREVLSNLMDNAIKYTSSEGEIEIRVILKPQKVGIEIRDTGYGIPPADQEHIFERHYRGVQGEGTIPGTGLGLAIVKELVEQMQGEIELISPNGKSQDVSRLGTTFKVWFKNGDNVSLA